MVILCGKGQCTVKNLNPKSRNGIIIMTALVPTIGHQHLVEFGSNFVMQRGKLTVIICALEDEPVDVHLRYNAFYEQFKSYNNVTFVKHIGNDPQNPSGPDDKEFWEHWKNVICKYVTIKSDDCVIASETYGIDLAKVLGCEFIPCNIYRETVPIKGTNVRENLLQNFNQVMPSFRKHLMKTVTIFGVESCGKTTMTKYLAEELNGYFVPEWAREYLEVCGSDVTEQKMVNITEAQHAIQLATHFKMDKPFIFQDTDLLSTIGYYEIMFGKIPENNKNNIMWRFNTSKSDLYVVMNDGIPFEADILRYGGDKRESNTQFWIDLLKEHECNYVVMPYTEISEQRKFLVDFLVDFWHDSFVKKIQSYKRA